MVVAAGGDEAAGVRLIGGDDAHAGHEVGVAIHAVHRRVAPALTTEAEITERGVSLYYSITAQLL